MPNSLRSKLSSLRYKGKITEEEYKDLIRKLDGHDKALRTPWIPVSERFPEEGQKVLCQCQAGIIDVFTWSKSVGWIENDTNAYMPLFVVAWRYLPEPYKAESEDRA